MIYLLSYTSKHFFYNKKNGIFYGITGEGGIPFRINIIGEYVLTAKFEYELPSQINMVSIISLEILREKVFEISLNKLL
jgi:hypothetical protein